MTVHSHAIGLPTVLASILILLMVRSIASAPAHPAPDRRAAAIPAAISAQVVVSPTITGGFGSPNTASAFLLRIDNLSASADTFDLLPSSPWPMTFYRLDGVTPLTDTDDNGSIDTGLVSPNFFIFITVKITPPASAVVGQYSASTLMVRSSNNIAQSATASYTIAIPAPFAQSFTLNDRPYLNVNRAWLNGRQQTTAQFGYEPSLATAPTGQFVQAWEQSRTLGNLKKVYELLAVIFDGQGNPTSSPFRLTDLSAATLDTHDHQPAIAVTPDGHFGVLWYRTINAGPGNFNYNVYFMILNLSGGVVLPATNLTNNSQYGTALTPNVPQFFEPSLTASCDNRFILAWRRQSYTGSTTRNTVWLSVRDAGTQIKAPTQLDSNTCSYHPHLTPLADGSIFLVRETCANVSYARLNSSGTLLHGPIGLTTSNGNGSPVATQLANGNILLAWQHNFGTRFALQYALLNSALAVIKNPTDLPSISPAGDKAISVTRAANKATLTWTDVYTYQPNLYYALLDNSGQLVTPPLVAATDTNNALSTVQNGQGNTYVIADTTPPSNPTMLNSPSHTINQWSNDNTIDITWLGASDSGGSGLAGYSIGWDANPIGLPDTVRDLAAVISTTSAPLADGTWYFHLRTLDNDGNAAATAIHLGSFKIDTTPPQSSAQSPLYAIGPFTVTWSGSDASSSAVKYNVWVRAGAVGPWTAWLSNTTATSEMFTGTIGHNYYFRSEAVDVANNIEGDLPTDGDTHTTVAAFQIDGQVTNNRGEPIFNAAISTQPGALNVAQSTASGDYALYFAYTDLYTLTVNRKDFGVLPPRYNLSLTGTQTGVDFVLPPLNDIIINGGWESGDFTGWSVDPAITATIEFSAAHTGRYGLRLESNIDTPLLTQTVTLPITWSHPTLSLMYQMTQSSGAPFFVDVHADGRGLIQWFLVTPGPWTHDWIDLALLAGQTITLTVHSQDSAQPQQLYLDEISLGDTRRGVNTIFLPVVRRN